MAVTYQDDNVTITCDKWCQPPKDRRSHDWVMAKFSHLLTIILIALFASCVPAQRAPYGCPTVGILFDTIHPRTVSVALLEEQGWQEDSREYICDIHKPGKERRRPIHCIVVGDSLTVVLEPFFDSLFTKAKVIMAGGKLFQEYHPPSAKRDTVPELMHISTRPKGFVVAQQALSVRDNGYCIAHLGCSGKAFPAHYKVGWCQGKEQLLNRLVKERRAK
jgi:hypothetical protein